MSVRRQVDWNAVEKTGQVRTMVEIETAEKILVCLAITAVLRNDYPGHGFEHFPGTADGAVFQLLRPDRTLGRSIGDADHAVASFLHHYLRQLRCRLLRLARVRGRGLRRRRRVSNGPRQTRQSPTKTRDQRQKSDACPVYAFSLPPDETHYVLPTPGPIEKKATNILPIFGRALGVRGQLVDHRSVNQLNFTLL